jgi:hypothetical protein
MPYQLEFRSLHNYDAGESGISVPVTLHAGSRLITLSAKVDTGATTVFSNDSMVKTSG